MSARSERACELRGLLVDMRTGMKALDRLFGAVDQAKVASLNRGSDDMTVWAFAAWLHHVYTGVESIFTRVAQVLDGYSTRADDWHRRLLVSMSEPLEGMRPAVLTESAFAWLDELRRFRHLFRHAYGTELDRHRVKDLVVQTLEMRSTLDEELHRLGTFVEALIKRHEQQDA